MRAWASKTAGSGRGISTGQLPWKVGACVGMAHFIFCGWLLRDGWGGFVVLLLDFPASFVFMHLGVLGFVLGGSIWWFFLAAFMTMWIRGSSRSLLRFLTPIPSALSGNEPAISQVFVPPIAVPHVIQALEDAIARQREIEKLPEEGHPSDFDRNDLALFDMVLSEVREDSSTNGAFITRPWSKPVQFSAAAVARYVSRHREALRAGEMQAFEQVVKDIMAYKWRPNASAPSVEPT